VNPLSCGTTINGGVWDELTDSGWVSVNRQNNNHDTSSDDGNDGAFVVRPPADRQFRNYRLETDCFDGGYYGSGTDPQAQVDYGDLVCSGSVSGPWNSDIGAGAPVCGAATFNLVSCGDWDVRLDWKVDGGFSTVVVDTDTSWCGIYSNCDNNRACNTRVRDLGSCGSGTQTDHRGVCQNSGAIGNGLCDDFNRTYNSDSAVGVVNADFWNGNATYPREVCDCTSTYNEATTLCGEVFNGYINYRETGVNQTSRNESRCGCQTCGRSCTGPSWARVCTPRSCTLFGCETANNCTYFVVQNQYRTPQYRDNCGCGRTRNGSEERYGP
jgi:hypothetical protein